MTVLKVGSEGLLRGRLSARVLTARRNRKQPAGLSSSRAGQSGTSVPEFTVRNWPLGASKSSAAFIWALQHANLIELADP